MLPGKITVAETAEHSVYPERDRYGGILAALSLDGTDAGQGLIAAGLPLRYDAGQWQSWCRG